MAGRHRVASVGLLATLARLPAVTRANRAARAKAAELLDVVGLGQYRSAEAAAMPYGALKRLEIARALAAEPKLLLLDEPAAGLNPHETETIRDLILALARTGITIVLVEHDMRLVMGRLRSHPGGRSGPPADGRHRGGGARRCTRHHRLSRFRGAGRWHRRRGRRCCLSSPI